MQALSLQPIRVGTSIPARPRTEPYVRLSRIRLPPRMFDGEAVAGPGVENAGLGKKVGGQRFNPFPRKAVLLTAPPKHASPEADRVEPEGPQCRKIRWHCVIGEKAGYDLPQP